MQDLNVRTKHFGQWWDALAKNGVERKIWLSQTGHVDPFDFRRGAWVDTLHRWFDHELLGYDNGIDREPMADIERHPDQWATSTAWPPRGTATTTLRPAKGTQPGVGTLGLDPGTGTETFTDDPQLSETDWAAQIDTSTPDKAGFITGPLTRDLRLSGSSKVTVTATPTTSTAHLSAVLVDLGPDTIRDYAGERRGHHHAHRPHLLGREHRRRQRLLQGDPGEDHRRRLHGRSAAAGPTSATTPSDHKGVPLTPGKAYTITLDLAATDHVVPAGPPPRADRRGHRQGPHRPAVRQARR